MLTGTALGVAGALIGMSGFSGWGSGLASWTTGRLTGGGTGLAGMGGAGNSKTACISVIFSSILCLGVSMTQPPTAANNTNALNQETGSRC